MSVMKQTGHCRRFASQLLGFRAILCVCYCPVLAPIPLATEGNDSEKLKRGSCVDKHVLVFYAGSQ